MSEVTELKPEIEEFVEESRPGEPPKEYKKENDTDMLYKMIKVLTERIDGLEKCLNDSRRINIVNQKNEE